MPITTIALIIFAVAALGGAFLALRHFTGKTQPMPVVLLHGLLAATGLACLLYAYFTNGLHGAGTTALVIFFVAALGGFFLFFTNLRGKSLPTPIVLLHAVLALTAFVVLATTLI